MQTNPRDVAGVKVLAMVDETGFPAGSGMGDHPVSWYRMFEGARTFVTLVGHDMSSFTHPDFLRHMTGGILWAGGWDGSTGLGRGTKEGVQATRNAAPERGAPGPQVYRGRDGMTLEIRSMDGRFIEARRFAEALPY